MKKALYRFREVICNIEGVKLACPDCVVPLEEAKLPLEGIGNNAVLPMMYCPECDRYFITWSATND